MSTLTTLVKLATRKLEEGQKTLAEIERRIQHTDKEIEQRGRDVQAAYATAQTSDDALLFRDAEHFAQRMQEQQERLRTQKKQMEEKKEELLAQIRTQYAEKKRYEVLHEQQQATEKKEREKKAQSQLEDLTNR